LQKWKPPTVVKLQVLTKWTMISDLPSFVVVSISLFSAVEIFEAVADVVVVETVEVSAPSAE